MTHEGRSPYKRQNKRPFQYSSDYDAWHAAVRNQHASARGLAARHTEWVERNIGPLPRTNEQFAALIHAAKHLYIRRGHRLTETRE